MRVVVAGATGFLGGYLLEALVQAGIETVALARGTSDLQLIDRLGIEKRFADLLDLESIGQSLWGAEVVINAAGKVSDWSPWREFHDLNVRGTVHLLLAAIRNRVRRFVHVSSFAAYGMRFFESRVLSEETPYQKSRIGRDFYCKSKFLAEEEVRKAAAEGKIEFAIFRPGLLIGERDSLATKRLASIIKGRKRILNLGKLNDKVQLDHANDVARAILAAGLHGPASVVYNVSSPPEITKSDFWSRALKGLGLQKEIREVSYPLGLFAGWVSENLHLLKGIRRDPKITLWSAYLMGNRNVVESSKILNAGWSPVEHLGSSIERAFQQYGSRS